MSFGEDTDEQLLDHFLLADNGLRELVNDLLASAL
jgi:hypothetical protein